MRMTYTNIKKLTARQETVPFVLLVAVLIISMILSENFRDLGFLLRTSTRYMELSLTALSMTLIVVAGMIDLSVPSIMCCSATIAALAYHGGLPMGLAILCGVLTGVLCGVLNGALVAYLRLPAMIVTIGTMNLIRGISQILIGDKGVGSLPAWFNGIDKRLVFQAGNVRFSVTVLAFLIAAAVFYLALHRTSFGRMVFSIGSNEQAAIHSGVNTKLIKMILFVLSGFIASIAGLATMSRLLLVRYDMNLNMEIEVVIMVLLGGADINGGRGSIIGTFIAVILVIILKTGLIIAHITSDAQMAVMGLILLVSIIIPNINTLMQELKDK
ncbi:MAG: ABC transporter permease [Spirochaetaceae bacterium]|nr:ABC transporter permease [Spirochaetaceae bacterium]